jgi:hypothetical protein
MVITMNTKDLLLRRIDDDYRIHFAHHVLFEDGLRKTINNATVNMEQGFFLRKAQPGDIFSYEFVGDYKIIKTSVEQNLSNIAKLSSQKQLPNLRRVWVVAYDIAEKDLNTGLGDIVVYADPGAADITKIIKDKRVVLGVFVIVEYDDEYTRRKPSLGAARTEWAYLSPGDNDNITEYADYLREREEEALRNLFFIHFDEKGIAKYQPKPEPTPLSEYRAHPPLK